MNDSFIAVSCGTPEPATILVIQIDPGPTPTFIASTPWDINSAVITAILLFISISPASAYLQFSQEHRVLSAGLEIGVEGYSVPTVADWNEDGQQDLIVGEGGSFIDSKVRIYLNVGTNEAPLFDGFVFAQQAEGDLAWPGG